MTSLSLSWQGILRVYTLKGFQLVDHWLYEAAQVISSHIFPLTNVITKPQVGTMHNMVLVTPYNAEKHGCTVQDIPLDTVIIPAILTLSQGCWTLINNLITLALSQAEQGHYLCGNGPDRLCSPEIISLSQRGARPPVLLYKIYVYPSYYNYRLCCSGLSQYLGCEATDCWLNLTFRVIITV